MPLVPNAPTLGYPRNRDSFPPYVPPRVLPRNFRHSALASACEAVSEPACAVRCASTAVTLCNCCAGRCGARAHRCAGSRDEAEGRDDTKPVQVVTNYAVQACYIAKRYQSKWHAGCASPFGGYSCQRVAATYKCSTRQPRRTRARWPAIQGLTGCCAQGRPPEGGPAREVRGATAP